MQSSRTSEKSEKSEGFGVSNDKLKCQDILVYESHIVNFPFFMTNGKKDSVESFDSKFSGLANTLAEPLVLLASLLD